MPSSRDSFSTLDHLAHLQGETFHSQQPAAGPGVKSVTFQPDAPAFPTGVSNLAKPKSTFATIRWLAVNTEGEALHLELAKLRVTHYLGVQLRDLRLLDPQLATSYPSAILARERAIVVNLEFIKCIIAMDNIYITNLDDPNTQSFVEELQRRLRTPPGGGFGGMFASTSATNLAGEHGGAGAGPGQGAGALQGPPTPRMSSVMAAPENLPFELRVLEVALDTVARYIENLSGDLEQAAHPALDALTLTINTSNLERVRRIKNRMVRLTTRVETLREVLEKFLDDDSDMKDLNLTAKEEDRSDDNERQAAAAMPFDVPLPFTGETVHESLLATPRPAVQYSSASSASSDSTDLADDPAVEVVEMVMEPYFMQVDNTYNKLQTLCEYIDDTEDYIAIQLDSHRNALIRLDLVLTSFSASVALITAITGLFAMNVMLRPDIDGQAPYSWFLAVSISTGIGAIVIFASVMTYCRWKRLI
ncbi:hypothetical protein D9Q98_000131 [Chlorella vulgaris]|uniref:Magnesium transporter n=1 Tax=Chlorella vulgaris TaxID=3077 RepID=A0A9D4TXL5_CHLVU|nr:hypothetical protein D9Q98_000131 [Chlorella vulgaris]